MARILISEPHADVRRLLVRIVARLGHEPLAPLAPSPEQLRGADLFLIEPSAPIGAVLAQAAHLIDPAMPLVCVSVEPPPQDLLDLGIEFAASLLKPFTLEELHDTIELALSRRRLDGSFRSQAALE